MSNVWGSPYARTGMPVTSGRRVAVVVGVFVALAAIVVLDHGDQQPNGGLRVDPGWALSSAVAGSLR